MTKSEELDEARVKAFIHMWENAPMVYHGIKMLSNGNKETDCLPYLIDV